MHLTGKKKIVLLGMMSRMPVAGVVWQTAQYLVGFQRLGFDVYYVEAHGCTPSNFVTRQDDGSAKAATFIAEMLRRFDLGSRWAFHARHADGRCLGMSAEALKQLYASADLIINLHGGTVPLPEHYATGRLVYLETDPVELQIEIYDNVQRSIDFLAPHCAFFTFGENFGRADCELPVSERFRFRPTRQPVVCEFWKSAPRSAGEGEVMTTIANWRQTHRDVEFNGETYTWSKHVEFLKFVDLPRRTKQEFELALATGSRDETEREMLENNGWRVRASNEFSYDLDAYRRYIAGSRGEFTVAKDQNVRLRTGWFSDRSAAYLAAGRPVITQETGFSNVLPVGAGLFGFSTMDDILTAVERMNVDYERHSRAAAELAREYFSYDVVLKDLLAEVGL
jgi:hypothetical protein